MATQQQTKSSSDVPLLQEHSVEEIQLVKDNLAEEIKKKTEELKTIVKNKYHDLVEAGEPIRAMKSKLQEVERSIWTLDNHINLFYSQINESAERLKLEQQQQHDAIDNQVDDVQCITNVKNAFIDLESIYNKYHEIWDYFDSGDLKSSLATLDQCYSMLTTYRLQQMQSNSTNSVLSSSSSLQDQESLKKLEISLGRAKEIMKNQLNLMIQDAPPDQIGILVSDATEDRDLFLLSLTSCVDLLSQRLAESLATDEKLSSKRSPSIITQTIHLPRPVPERARTVDDQDNRSNIDISSSPYQSIPEFLSLELSDFLFQVCKSMNTIAGYQLDQDSIGLSLELTLTGASKVYKTIIDRLDSSESGRTRGLQLYFDLLYLKLLLSHCKDIILIEKLDPPLSEMATKLEELLDPIEFCIISDSLRSNVLRLYDSTKRLHGLITTDCE